MRRAVPLIFATALAACGGKAPAPTATTPATAPSTATTAVPSDPKLAKVYSQTCKACHTAPGTGAPQAGDRNAWQPRLAQGMPVLLQHAINGYKGMPPLGSCMDCTEAEFEALINFMSGQ
jgi:cytochrome c5